MPKAEEPATERYPLNGLFAIDKPTGLISMKCLDQLKPLLISSPIFRQDPDAAEPPSKKRKYQHGGRGRRKGGGERIKLGQGGTLDPLASGVLVIGVNGGTKSLQTYLAGPKEYRVTGVLGAATDSLDAEGKVTHTAPWRHVTREKVEAALEQFRGDITQYPPAYSAVMIDGKRLYEYARSGTPLPRPVEARKCHISSLTLEAWHEPSSHSYAWPSTSLTVEELEVHHKLMSMIGKPLPSEAEAAPTVEDDIKVDANREEDAKEGATAAFSLRMTVSGGTYIRSIVDDLATILDSAAFVAKLERTKQGPFEIGERDCVPWEVLSNAAAALEKDARERTVDEEKPEWEEELLKRFHRT